MAKIERFNGNMQAFGATSQGTERTVFGNTTQSNTLNDNINTNYIRGWGTLAVGSKPSKQWFNGIHFTLGQTLSYLHQQGVPEWNTSQEFFIDSITKASDGKLYISKTGTTGTPNTGNDPISSPSNWQKIVIDPADDFKSGVINGSGSIQRLQNVSISNSLQYGLCDCWLASCTGTVSAGTITADNSYSNSQTNTAIHLSGVTASGSGILTAVNRVESALAVQYAEKTSSVQVKVEHDVGSNINYAIELSYANAKNDFSATTTISTSSAISVANSAATVIKFENISIPAQARNGLELKITATAGAITTKNFHFSEAQINVGNFISAYVENDHDTDIAYCARYYVKSYNDGIAISTVTNVGLISTVAAGSTSGTAVATGFFNSEMIKIPTVSIYGPFTGSAGVMENGVGPTSVAGTAQNTSKKSTMFINTANVVD